MEFTKALKKSGGVQPETKLNAMVEETDKNAEDDGVILDDADMDQATGGKGLRTKRKDFG